MSAYYNEYDPFAAEWLRNLIKAGQIADGEVDSRSIVDVRPDDRAVRWQGGDGADCRRAVDRAVRAAAECVQGGEARQMTFTAFLCLYLYAIGSMAVGAMVADYIVQRGRRAGWREFVVIAFWPVSMLIASCYVVLSAGDE